MTTPGRRSSIDRSYKKASASSVNYAPLPASISCWENIGTSRIETGAHVARVNIRPDVISSRRPPRYRCSIILSLRDNDLEKIGAISRRCHRHPIGMIVTIHPLFLVNETCKEKEGDGLSCRKSGAVCVMRGTSLSFSSERNEESLAARTTTRGADDGRDERKGRKKNRFSIITLFFKRFIFFGCANRTEKVNLTNEIPRLSAHQLSADGQHF